MSYTAFDIGADLVPYGCNQAGTSLTDLVVVGYNYVTAVAFVYQNGVTTYLPSLSGSIPDAGFTSCAASVSAAGTTIGGVCTDSSGIRRPVYWTGSGATWTIHQLSEPIGYTDRYVTPYEPYGVSVSGDGLIFASAMGSALAASTPSSFLYWSGGTPTLLSMGGEELEATNVGISYTGNVIYAVRGVAPTWFISYWTAGVRAEVTVPTFPDNGYILGPAAYAAANDGSRGVITANYADDFTAEAPRGFYTDNTHTLVLLDLPVGATESRAFCCDETCTNIAGHTNVGAVLWAGFTPEILPALSGATADNSYWAYGMTGDAGLIVGVGNDSLGALKGIIWYSATPPVSTTISAADMWFGPTDGFIDLSVVANRRKFISSAGATVNLGTDGSAPFNAIPPVFLTLTTGEPADNWALNEGSAGAFTITSGSLALSSSAPACDATSTILPSGPLTVNDPQMMLTVSKDGGYTWTPVERWLSMGRIGEYYKRMQWTNLGNSRTWIFRLICTDPVRRAIIGVYKSSYKGYG